MLKVVPVRLSLYISTLLSLVIVTLSGCVPLQPLDAKGSSIVALPINAPADYDVQVDLAEPNSATVTQVNGRTLIEFDSPRGLGHAQITVGGQDEIGSLTLRFHLQGLEYLRVATPKMAVVASISSSNNNHVVQEAATIQQSGSSPEAMVPIDAESPFWMEITGPSTVNESATEGYVDVAIPNGFLMDTEPIMTIEWIDFYR